MYFRLNWVRVGVAACFLPVMIASGCSTPDALDNGGGLSTSSAPLASSAPAASSVVSGQASSTAPTTVTAPTASLQATAPALSTTAPPASSTVAPGASSSGEPPTPSASASLVPSAALSAAETSSVPVPSVSASSSQGGPPSWVGSWATAPQLTETANLPPTTLGGNTLRQYVFPTLSGQRVRLQLSNLFGNGPVTLNKVHLAKSVASAGQIDAASDTALSFEGSPNVTIPAGEAVWSDPQDFTVEALKTLAVSIEFGTVPTDVTGHPGSRTTSYIQTGAAAASAAFAQAVTTDHWYFITGLDVEADASAGAIVILGDSITDGRGSTTNGNNRWPDNLARRLRASAAHDNISVLNMGIGGNNVATEGLGPNAVARFDRDVLGQSGARWLIVLEGVNDIGAVDIAAQPLIDAYTQFIQKAHTAGMLAYGAPILPFGGSSYDTPAREMVRQTVNDWIRTSGEFDAVIDLDAAVRDPSNMAVLKSSFDDGDHLHLTPAGYQAMADAVDLSLFSLAQL